MNTSPIAVVALGVLNPAARALSAFESALRTGVRKLSKVDAQLAPRGKALLGQVVDDTIPARFRAFHLAKAATREALAQWDPRGRVGAAEIGYFLSSIGGESAEVETYKLAQGGPPPRRHRVKACYGSVPNGRLHFKLARAFGFCGPQIAISNTCASGNVSMGIALDMIREGGCRAAVISAVELCTLGTLWGADRAAILGTKLAPFDATRDGAIFGEGAATVILADPSIVDPQDVLGWLCGFGSSCDAENAAIAFEPDGAGLYRAMDAAARDAALDPAALDYVNAHAPGTPVIDKLECKAVADLLHGAGKGIAINSTKSITTHLAGAGSITEAAATILQMNGGFVHGNAGLATRAPDLALEPIGDQAVDRPVRTALSNALGGGGLYTSVVFRHRDWTPPSAPAWAGETSGEMAVVAQAAWLGSAESIDLPSRFPALMHFTHMNRAAQLALAASSEIFSEGAAIPRESPSGLTPTLGVFSATFLGGLPESMSLFLDLLANRPKAIKPSTVLDHGVNLGGALVGRYHGLTGPNYSFVGSRTSAMQALVSGMSHLRAGRIEAALVTGFDAVQGLRESQLPMAFEGTARMVDATGAVLLKTSAHLRPHDRVLGKIGAAAVVRLASRGEDLQEGLRRLTAQLRTTLSTLRLIRVSNYSPIHGDELVRACWDVFGDVQIVLEDVSGSDALAAGALLLLKDALRNHARTLIIQVDEYLQLGGLVVEGSSGGAAP